MVAGAAVASANTSAATSSAYNAGVAAGSAGTTSAYNAGLAAGGGVPPAAVPLPSTPTAAAGSNFAMGGIYATLPAGCITPSVQGKNYYLCGNTWFKPLYGANGVYYTVVPTP